MVANTSFGPVNIPQGASASFVIEFLDTNGNLTVPSSGNLTVTYTNTANTSQTDTVTLTLIESFYTGRWSSTSAALGIASWLVTAAGSSVTQQTGTLQVVQNV